MEITEVRIKLMEESEDRLRGFCSITFDHCFVVRDLKIIQGNSGPFVAMPSRKLTGNCRKCGTKNHLRANYCNNCGVKITSQQIMFDATGRAKLYADIAHPVNARCREMIQRRIVEELNREIELSSQPGYKSRYDDDYDDDFEPEDFSQTSSVKSHSSSEPRIGNTGKNEETDGIDRTDPAGSALDERAAPDSSQRHDSAQSQLPSPHDRIDPKAPHAPPPDSKQGRSNNSDDEFGQGLL